MSEPNKVPVFVVPAGTWMPIVGETEAIDLLSPFRVVAERDYAKLAQALTLANQRAEAAEASLAVAWASMETMQSVIDTLIAERDALRKDAAAISSTMKDAAWLLLHASRQGVNEHRAMVEASCNLTEHIERITAALAVQPSTGDTK